VIPLFVQRALQGQPLTVAGDGTQFRQFVYVEDLAEGVVLSLKPIAANRIYNLDGGECISIRQMAEAIQDLVGNVEIVTAPSRPGDFSGKRVRSDRAAQELGWRPTVPFQDGVQHYIDWYRSRVKQQEISWSKVDAVLRD
jgi:UDP-glucose 4-epimerase